MIKVSIIIPAYNVEKYIGRCIESAMNQTLKEIEIIVVNDGATDNTPSIISKFAEKDPRVVVIHKKNGGLSSARNAGLNLAKGEYIQHLDGDDWVERGASESMFSFAKKEELDIVICDFYRDDDNGNIERWNDLKENKIYSSDEYIKHLFSGEGYNCVCNKLFKKSLYKEIRAPESISLGEDLVVLGRFALKANKIGKLNGCYLHYIINPNSITEDRAHLKFLELIEAHNVICQYYKEENVLDIYKDILSNASTAEVGYFIFHEGEFSNPEYMNVAKGVLSFFRLNYKVGRRLNYKKRVFIKILSIFPNMITLKTLVTLSSILKKLNKSFAQ